MFFNLLSALIKVHILPRLPAVWQRKMTEKRVIRSVRDAYYYIPFYRRKYDDAGIDITTIRGLEDMKRLPLLTKEEVRQNFPEGMVRRGTNLDKCYRSYTSGSSGQPLSFIISPSGYAYYLAESTRIYSMTGYRPWYRSCYLCSRPLDLPKISSGRQMHISTTLPVPEQIALLKKYRPHLIDAHPNTLLDICSHLSRDDLKVIKPRIISINSEMSTSEDREHISRIFNCPVFDEYGSYEFWSIAAQCKKRRYHISSDSVWLEFVDSLGRDISAGEAGNIIITSTRSEAMPFIRYVIGDTGRPCGETCSCGYRSPLLQSFEGRANDWLTLPSGKRIEPSRVLGVCSRVVSRNPMLFERYRIIQKKPDLIVFQYLCGKDFKKAILDDLLLKIGHVFDEPVNVIAEEGGIPCGGKRQALQSLVTNGNLI